MYVDGQASAEVSLRLESSSGAQSLRGLNRSPLRLGNRAGEAGRRCEPYLLLRQQDQMSLASYQGGVRLYSEDDRTPHRTHLIPLGLVGPSIPEAGDGPAESRRPDGELSEKSSIPKAVTCASVRCYRESTLS